MKKIITRAAVVLLLAVFMVPSAMGQEIGIIQATATVISSLSILGSNNLVFGSVTPGINKIVPRTSAGFAGEWSITGTSLSELSLTFTLPTVLDHSSVAATMPISFNSTDAALSDGTGSQSTPNAVFDPNGPSVFRLGAGGLLFVWIGGTVQPSVAQSGGDYASNVTLTIAYTGN
ncbi:MAG: hypothetical protein V3T75_00430 [candidate division Zixibacteria bacterium]